MWVSNMDCLCPEGTYCGRQCIRDPEKRNGLLFWPDGRLKTLEERGLGFNSPPLVEPKVPKRKRPDLKVILAKVEGKVSRGFGKAPKEVAPEKLAKELMFDKKAYQREYMRRKRARKEDKG